MATFQKPDYASGNKSTTDNVTIGGHSDAAGAEAAALRAILAAKPPVTAHSKAFAAAGLAGKGGVIFAEDRSPRKPRGY